MTQEVKLRRVQCNYQAENARFLLECDFSQQYANYYRKRLEKTRPFLEYNCRSKWNPSTPIYTLTELAAVAPCYSDDDIDAPLSPSMSPDSPGDSFKFFKRMRRHSESSPRISPHPRSSTQNRDDEGQASTSLFRSPDVSLGQRQQDVESPVTPARSGSRTPSECIVIGTIFKRMKLQPSVVDELSRGDFHVKCERYQGHYTSQDDRLVLEDNDESIALVGRIDPKNFVTGVVLALLGVPIDGGSQFMVRDICFAEANREILYEELTSQPVSEATKIERPIGRDPVYLMVVSALGFNPDMGRQSALTFALQNMIDFIWGGGKYADDERSPRVTRILVAGDCLHESRLLVDERNLDDEGKQFTSDQTDNVALKLKRSRQVKQYPGTITAVKHMDDFFAQLSKTIDVDVMPGPSDPSSHLMPQQPFHPCMFPKSCMFSTFNCITNPHHAIYNDNVELMATSSQNIDIISKFSGISDPIEIMKSHLMWANCAPSAPDNLYSVPYEEEDPYVIDFIPEIYIAGCQPTYRTAYYEYDASLPSEFSQRINSPSSISPIPGEAGIRQRISSSPLGVKPEQTSHTDPFSSENRKRRTKLITVPKFCETFSCVLINLKDLQSELMYFK